MENTVDHINFDKHKLNAEQLIVAFYKYEILSFYILNIIQSFSKIDIDNLNEDNKERLHYIKNLKESYRIRMYRNERYYRSMFVGIGNSSVEYISTLKQLSDTARDESTKDFKDNNCYKFIEIDDEKCMVLNIQKMFIILDKYENEIKVLWEDI